MPIGRFIRAWREWRAFRRLTNAERTLVVYSEDAGSWPHLGPVVEALLARFDGTVCYVTSDEEDPQLTRKERNFRGFYIGSGVIRTSFFTMLEAGVLLMTMPDLETYHVKRSRAAPVHYVYLFHSLVSTHMIYRKGAFDHFDTILCAGPHHREEIRETERVYDLPAKTLIDHGYGKIDTILRDAPARDAAAGDEITVLVAPSWGANALLETRGAELASVLLENGFRTIVRPHPMTVKKAPAAIRAMTDRFSSHAKFSMDLDMSSRKSLDQSDVMISDWSGAALEYAFGRERPVLFVDVPRKVNNPDYEKINCIPVEVSIRPEIGEVVDPGDISSIPRVLRALCGNPSGFRERIARLRRESIYNVGKSAATGAEAILDIIERLRRDA